MQEREADPPDDCESDAAGLMFPRAHRVFLDEGGEDEGFWKAYSIRGSIPVSALHPGYSTVPVRCSTSTMVIFRDDVVLHEGAEESENGS